MEETMCCYYRLILEIWQSRVVPKACTPLFTTQTSTPGTRTWCELTKLPLSTPGRQYTCTRGTPGTGVCICLPRQPARVRYPTGTPEPLTPSLRHLIQKVMIMKSH
eukprot:3334333-Rhodomonas_salina.1